jgi:energy-converting hydrogenase Eha subunit H
MLAFLALLFVRSFKALQTRDLLQRSITLGALAGCFGIAVHSFVEFNLQVTANAQLFLALAALATTKVTVEEPVVQPTSKEVVYTFR